MMMMMHRQKRYQNPHTHCVIIIMIQLSLSLSRRIIVTVFALQKGPDIIITQGLWWGQILWWVIKPQTGWKLRGWIIIINKYTGVCIYFFLGGIDPVTGGFPVIYTFNSPLISFDYISVFKKVFHKEWINIRRGLVVRPIQSEGLKEGGIMKHNRNEMNCMSAVV